MTDSKGRLPAISRRDLLRTAGAAGAAALVPDAVTAATAETTSTAAAGEEQFGTALPSETGPLLARALANLTARETEILSAMVDRLIPSDELGPGALDAGVLRFIDRVLSESGTNAADAYRSGLAALDTYSRYTRGGPFIDLSTVDQDSVLIDVQIGAATGAGVGFVGGSGSFFNMVKSHTWQGMFGDSWSQSGVQPTTTGYSNDHAASRDRRRHRGDGRSGWGLRIAAGGGRVERSGARGRDLARPTRLRP